MHKKTALVGRRHSEVCGAFGDLASLVWSAAMREAIVCDGSDDSDILIADLCVWGIWQPQVETLFDIRVVDTDDPSYCAHTPCSAEAEKGKIFARLLGFCG